MKQRSVPDYDRLAAGRTDHNLEIGLRSSSEEDDDGLLVHH